MDFLFLAEAENWLWLTEDAVTLRPQTFVRTGVHHLGLPLCSADAIGIEAAFSAA